MCRGEDVDPAPLIEALLADATELVAGQDPLEVEVAGAALFSTVNLAAGQLGVATVESSDQMLLDGLIPEFEARASTEGMAMLLALGAVAPDQVGAAASAAADRLVRGGVTRPGWADELLAPVTSTDCWRFSDPAGTGSVLGASFTRAGRSHAMLVSVDALDCGAATSIALLDADGLAPALAVIRSVPPDDSGQGGEIIEEALDAAEWRWQVGNALDARAVHDHDDAVEFDPDELDDEEQDADSYPALAVLLRARMATMPASPKPTPPHGGRDESLAVDLASLAQTLEQLLDRAAAGRGRAPRSGSARAAKPGATRAKLGRKRARRDRPAPIYQIKVGVCHAKPPIWRRLQLPADTSLAALHDTIQVAFEWDDYHMHLFHTPYGEFGAADAGLGHRAEAPVTLEQVAPTAGDKIGYSYDFGDDWNLDIVVEKVLATDSTTSYPRCTGGRRAAPPEDSGGIHAYTHFAAALADPDHPDHNAKDRLEDTALDPDFDPAHFDADHINKALSRLQ